MRRDAEIALRASWADGSRDDGKMDLPVVTFVIQSSVGVIRNVSGVFCAASFWP
jgi:hypothetical protein